MSTELDLDPLLETLYRASNGRVLRGAARTVEGELSIARIPVTSLLDDDKKDTALRKFIRDWFRRNTKDTGIDVRMETLPRGAGWEDDAGNNTPVVAAIKICWWPKPPEPEFDRWKREIEAKRAKQRREMRQERSGPNVVES